MGNMKGKTLVFMLLFAVAIVGFLAYNNTRQPALEEGAPGEDPLAYEGTVKIGAQTVNESIVLAWMGKLLVESHTSLDVDINTEFAASSVLHQAMAGRELDIYPSWTGTQLTGIMRYEGPNLPSEETFKMVKEGFEKTFKMTWAAPIGFNNTYVMAIPRAKAEELGLKKASDLKGHSETWKLGSDENFDTRPDGYPGWTEAYGIEFGDVLPMQYSIMYRAIAGGEVDAIVAYSTDSRIKKLDLALLEDDKSFFPDYSAAFVVRMDTLENYPALLSVLEKLSGQIDEVTMSELNGRFDDGEEPEDIAKDFLTQAGLI
ncbi:MAG TPA: osmoprotectant ABC transporter substrate-binding protein [Synergistetes bacterium]|nr:osmoprotectant ABC transporter substrate-binding protein [Synergistota bacterium]